VDVAPKQVFNVWSQLVDRLTRGVCELCGSGVGVEVHHVRKLKNLRRVGCCEKSEWVKCMIVMRCKSLVVCGVCHCRIYVGCYDGVWVC